MMAINLSFDIPFLLPGLNDLIQGAKTGRGPNNRYRKMKAEAEAHVTLFACAALGKQLSFLQAVQVHFLWREKNQRRDKDNIAAGGRKIILDTLTKMGVLHGDGWKGVSGFVDEFEVNRKNPGVTVTIHVPIQSDAGPQR